MSELPGSCNPCRRLTGQPPNKGRWCESSMGFIAAFDSGYSSALFTR
ncbi:hypothetical protein C4K38_1854 [Pseudomonas chlororaphis subsp. piscium]|nr:hypothetical protein C4K38_1854 [Pseudomonas chlororaphis subsp. piscium]